MSDAACLPNATALVCSPRPIRRRFTNDEQSDSLSPIRSGPDPAVAQLPALPQSAIKLLELSRDPENGPPEFAVPIEADPGLAGQILKFVNSSYFGFSREINNVRMAITLVGIRTIKNFSLWSAVFSLLPNPKCGPFDLKSLWQDSLRRALFSRAMGKLLGLKEAEEAFSAALLQDMAIPLLAKELPTEYIELLVARQDGQRRLSDSGAGAVWLESRRGRGIDGSQVENARGVCGFVAEAHFDFGDARRDGS